VPGGWIYFDKQLFNTKIIIILCKIKGIQYELINYTYKVEYSEQCLTGARINHESVYEVNN